MQHKVVNFYQFLNIEQNLADLREQLEIICKQNNLLGTVLLAPEGANFGLSGADTDLDLAIEQIRTQTPFNQFDVKASWGQQQPYPRLKVKIQKSVITFTENDPSPDKINAGKRLTPAQWKEYLERDDVIVVDTRNEYEVEWGKFSKAISFNIDKFSDFPEKFLDQFANHKDKTFLMYCTGGIRCEKTVAWAHDLGFENAYQLDGGIIGYLEKEGSAHYEGSCFVFDRRWSVDSELEEVNSPSHLTESQKKLRQPKQFFQGTHDHPTTID